MLDGFLRSVQDQNMQNALTQKHLAKHPWLASIGWIVAFPGWKKPAKAFIRETEAREFQAENGGRLMTLEEAQLTSWDSI